MCVHNHHRTHMRDVTGVALFCSATDRDTQLQVVFVPWFCSLVTCILFFTLFTCIGTETGYLITNLCAWRKMKTSEPFEAHSDISLNIFKAVNNTDTLFRAQSRSQYMACFVYISQLKPSGSSSVGSGDIRGNCFPMHVYLHSPVFKGLPSSHVFLCLHFVCFMSGMTVCFKTGVTERTWHRETFLVHQPLG